MMIDVLALLVGLSVKHFIVDFPLQTAYQYENKGEYEHWGGILHSILHVLGTLLILWLFEAPLYFYTVWGVASFEFLIHYHMDWFKVNMNKWMGWGPTTHNEYWILLGFDQLVHTLTYIGIVWLFYYGG